MANGEICTRCGYLESHHTKGARQYYGQIKFDKEFSALTCPGFSTSE